MSLKEKLQIVLNQRGNFVCPATATTAPGPQTASTPKPAAKKERTHAERFSLVVADLHKRGNARPGTVDKLLNTIKGTIAEAGAKGPGRVGASVRANGRFDVVVHTSHGYPRIVVEVKRHVSRYEQIRKDVDRVVSVVTRSRATSSISFGALTFLVWLKDDRTFNAAERVRKTIENLANSTAEAAGEKVKVLVDHSPVRVEDDRAWAAVAIAIKPRAA